METNKFEKVEIKATDMLITPLPDYFKKKESGKMNTHMSQNDTFDVGIIEAVGSELDDKRIGKVIYYQSNLAKGINIKGIGVYDLLAEDYKLLIRHDQDINNN